MAYTAVINMRRKSKPEKDKWGEEEEDECDLEMDVDDQEAEAGKLNNDWVDYLTQIANDSDESPASQEFEEASETSEFSGKKPEMSLDRMTKIARFYEERPMFYDWSDENYKNNQMKEEALEELGEEIGLSANTIKRHFRSMRTDHHKLAKKPKTGPEATLLTKLQKFKLEAYKFLDFHHKPRSHLQFGIRRARVSDVYADIVDESSTPSSSGKTGTSAPPQKKTRQSLNTSQEADVLQDEEIKSIHEERNEQKVEQKVVATKTTQTFQTETSNSVDEGGRLSGERQAWANWLVSIIADIPQHRFRQYQTESFGLVMRYVQSESEPQGQANSFQQSQPQGHANSFQQSQPQGHANSLQQSQPQGHANSLQQSQPQGHANSFQQSHCNDHQLSRQPLNPVSLQSQKTSLSSQPYVQSQEQSQSFQQSQQQQQQQESQNQRQQSQPNGKSQSFQNEQSQHVLLNQTDMSPRQNGTPLLDPSLSQGQQQKDVFIKTEPPENK